MTTNRSAQRRTHPASFVLAAVGCIGIGAMIGGWSNTADAAGKVTGISIDTSGNYMYRAFESGRVERLQMSRGVTSGGTTASWTVFSN